MHPVFGAGDGRATRVVLHRLRQRPRRRAGACASATSRTGSCPTTVFSRLTWLADDDGRAAGRGPRAAFLAAAGPAARRDRAPTGSRCDGGRAHVGEPRRPAPDAARRASACTRPRSSSTSATPRASSSCTTASKLAGLLGANWSRALTATGYTQAGMALLGGSATPVPSVPELLEKFFLPRPAPLHGPLVDDRPLSETRAGPAVHRRTAATTCAGWSTPRATSLDALRTAGRASPTDAADGAAVPDAAPRAAARATGTRPAAARSGGRADRGGARGSRGCEPRFVHVAEPAARPVAGEQPLGQAVRFDQRSESRYEYLYRAEPAVTGSRTCGRRLHPARARRRRGARCSPSSSRRSTGCADTPTARLERLLAEHVDLLHLPARRLAAGLVHLPARGAALRSGDGGRARRHLGAYGWLEDVRREDKRLDAGRAPPDLADGVHGPATPPLMRDAANGGYVHAPSLNQAATAAILRNGYLANATPGSARRAGGQPLLRAGARRRSRVLEGIRGGQTLGALLGYRLERGLHDRHRLAEVDAFIFDAAQGVPARRRPAGRHARPTRRAIEADRGAQRRRRAARWSTHVKRQRATTLPVRPLTCPPATPDAGGGHRRGGGRGCSTSTTRSPTWRSPRACTRPCSATPTARRRRSTPTASGSFPPEPDVVRTPRSGIALTHRVGLHLEPGRDPAVPPARSPVTPRAHAEPAVNAWLAALLPAPGGRRLPRSTLRPTRSTARRRPSTVTQADLGLQPLDLLYMLADAEASRR